MHVAWQGAARNPAPSVTLCLYREMCGTNTAATVRDGLDMTLQSS